MEASTESKSIPGAAKVDNLGDKQQNGASKKPRQKVKPKHTVPRPFLLATEKRIPREIRLGSMDLNEPKQKLSKSVSFNSSAKTSVSAPVSSKENQGEASEKSPAFKALPLPSFYHKKHAQNKVQVTQQTSVLVKSAKDKPKKVLATRIISNKANETIGHQMLKSTHKVVIPAKSTRNAVTAIA